MEEFQSKIKTINNFEVANTLDFNENHPTNGKRVIILLFSLLLLSSIYIFIVLYKPQNVISNNQNARLDSSPIIYTSDHPSRIPTHKPNRIISPIPIPTQFIGQFDVIIKETKNDERSSDVFLRNKKTDIERYFTTIKDVYHNHYHTAEFHNGNLYIIVRPGGDNVTQINPQWTDELIRIDFNNRVKKLISDKGVDFRVSEDEARILSLGGLELNIMDYEGNSIKKIPYDQITINNNLGYSFLEWGEHEVWFYSAGGPVIESIAKLNMDNYDITKYDLRSYERGTEYVFNPKIQKLAFSDYPALFDVEGYEEFKKSGRIITLSIYDVRTQTVQEIATTISKQFNPVWISDRILEYNDSKSNKRISHHF